MSKSLVEYYPKYIEDDILLYSKILPELLKTTKTYTFKMYDKIFTSKRRSCVYSNQKRNIGIIGYNQTPIFPWKNAPKEIISIRNRLITEFDATIDYVLVHIYRNDQDYIGWHNDSEALNSDVFSISLGMSRRFLTRPYNSTSGVEKEYLLKSGDLIRMIKGCQSKYKHTVPKMKCSELKTLVIDNNIEIKGRATFVKLRELIEKHQIDTRRINMTFRSLELE
uniref:Alkylated DNA repair dioxygenase n=1 Tax=Pithovirus LCPAC001 TaxID=2506585 RepID=A0A481Z1I5_9VIRU|nr:MAG: alkylated DNA repair dioxygenase [Pithovirus LCPAC001]